MTKKVKIQRELYENGELVIYEGDLKAKKFGNSAHVIVPEGLKDKIVKVTYSEEVKNGSK